VQPILIEWLPGYAPELNLVVYVRGYWKPRAVRNFSSDDLAELGFVGRRARQRPKISPFTAFSYRVRAECFQTHMSELTLVT
jgi:hypothetical protein